MSKDVHALSLLGIKPFTPSGDTQVLSKDPLLSNILITIKKNGDYLTFNSIEDSKALFYYPLTIIKLQFLEVLQIQAPRTV